MEITKSNAKRWSIIGSRATFGLSMVDLAKSNERLMAITADVSTSAGLERFKNIFPNQYIDVGIAEQNMMGIATGLSSEGFNVVTTTFAPFQTMRCCEQIRVNQGYMGMKVCMVGLASGVVLGTLGNTHCCFEDISIIRSIPNIAIISPADCGEVVKAIKSAIEYPQSVYIRLTGGTNMPIIYNEEYEFKIGKAIRLKEGNDIAIISNGTMVSRSLEAAAELEAQGISTMVVNMHTIKPLDSEIISEICKDKKMIVTIEEHNVVGGLGTAVAEYKSTLEGAPKQIFIGLPDQYVKSGEYEEILNQNGLTVKNIVEKIKKELL